MGSRLTLPALRSMLATLKTFEGSKSLQGRVAGCIGSYRSLKPWTLKTTERAFNEFMRSAPKPIVNPPAPKKLKTWNPQSGRLSDGCEFGPDGIERPETFDVPVRALLAETENALLFDTPFARKPVWIPLSQIFEPFGGPTDDEVTIPLWLAIENRLT